MNSIKILKNQSKWQKRKQLIFINLAALLTAISCSILVFYLIQESPIIFNTENETHNNNIDTVSSINIQENDVFLENPFTNISNKENIQQPDIPRKQTQASVFILPQQLITSPREKPQNNTVQNIVKKLPPSILNETPSLTQTIKFDSIDVITLLELDMPISPNTP